MANKRIPGTLSLFQAGSKRKVRPTNLGQFSNRVKDKDTDKEKSNAKKS